MKKLLSSILLLFGSYAIGQYTITVSPSLVSVKHLPDAITVPSIDSALRTALRVPDKDIRILLHAGFYTLDTPIELHSSRWKGKKLSLAAYPGEKVTISGGKVLQPQWKKYKNGIWQTKTQETDFDQLFVNDTPRILARYPNYRKGQILNGSSADALSAQRIKKWKSPEGGYIHALHDREWGGLYYQITGKQTDRLTYTGGYQNNRPSAMHKNCIFVENIFEELDSPGEWFLDKQKGILYYYPLPGENLQNSTIIVSKLPELIRITGNENDPIRHITIRDIEFTHTTRTFLEKYEPLLRSDWCIHRGAAVFIEFADNCHIMNCHFHHLGGNAVFFSKFNQDCSIRSSHIHDIGASAVCFVGDTSAVRSGLSNYGKSQPLELMDLTPGPRN
ncbi:MAG: right-handed parallel beta-helix repeat-containing protein, partial [Odoribacter sp.]|nr:right-handed parallel beta-helix repeat-containing protein [Odoribacter sp.]